MRRIALLIIGFLFFVGISATLFTQFIFSKEIFYEIKFKQLLESCRLIEKSFKDNGDVRDDDEKVMEFVLNNKALPAFVVKDNQIIYNIGNKYKINWGQSEELDSWSIESQIIKLANSYDEPGYTTYGLDSLRVFIVIYPFETGEKLVLVQLDNYFQNEITQIYIIMIFSAFLIFVLLMIISFLIIRKVSKNVDDFNQKVAYIGNMEFEKAGPFDESHGPVELTRLKKSLNKMSVNLKNSINELNANKLALEKELAYKTKMEELRKKLFSDVSHELKTPIAVIQSYSEALLDGVGDEQFYKQSIFEESVKMEKMVQQLLQLAKYDAGEVGIEKERFNMSELVGKQVLLMKHLAEEDHASFQCHIETNVFGYGDESQIEQVVRNLLINGIQHGDHSEPIHVSLMSDNNQVVFKVINRVSKPQKIDFERIWDRFYKADESRHRESSGAGLGLAIVNRIMKLHDGKCFTHLSDNEIMIGIKLKNMNQ
ncbi:sensor histidine kinase [Vallitalea okinawensis]|uniref:sensor histidine kinase n=1 Tax=Vallitalea okinawensis TaxID=2078660 RepID=UPI000CFAA623|nr:HAMP domain-containing sensor histidine kinase [Vallitalea okinawensis]